MKQLARLALAAAALVAAVSFGALAGGVDLGGPLAGSDLAGVDFSGGGSAPTTITITSPAADPSAVSGTPTTVSGTTTGTITGVTWSTTCVAGPTACSTGAGTFSCSVTQTQACASSQTVTVTANGSVTDTTVVNFPTFDLVAGSTTPNDLPDALTINSVAMTLVLACDGQGEASATWACRDSGGVLNLTEAGSGGVPTTTTLTPFHGLDSAERGVVFATTGKRYDPATSATLDITTEDFVVLAVVKAGTSGTIIDKSLASTDGWRLKANGSTNMQLSLRTGSTTTTISAANSAPDTTFDVYEFFVDRSEASTNGVIGYANGTAGTGVDASARSGSMTNAVVASLGANSGSTALPSTIVSLRVWKCAGCMPGGATNATTGALIAREHTAIALGETPTLAVGVATPTALTRGSTAFTDVIDASTRHLYNFASHAPRTARRSAAGTISAGYLAEPQTTNLALQSETLGTTWTAIDVGDNVLANAYAGADLATTGDNIDGDNTGASEHGLRQAITVSATTHTFSAWAKGGAKTWVALRDNTVANAVASFDTAACAACDVTQGDCTAAVGTVGAGVSQARAIRYPIDTTGDGVADVELCRVSITYTGTAAAHDHDLLCAAGDNSFSYTDSDATADCGFWGAEVEAYPTMTSYQATTTASVTRSADVLSFDGASNASTSGTIAVSMLCPNFNVATTSKLGLRVDANNFMDLNIDAANDRPGAESTVASVAQYGIVGSSGDVADGSLHETRLTYSLNDVELFYDGTSVGTDTVATMMSTMTGATLGIGHLNSLLQSGCIHVRTRAWAVKALATAAP